MNENIFWICFITSALGVVVIGGIIFFGLYLFRRDPLFHLWKATITPSLRREAVRR